MLVDHGKKTLGAFARLALFARAFLRPSLERLLPPERLLADIMRCIFGVDHLIQLAARTLRSLFYSNDQCQVAAEQGFEFERARF